MTKQQNNCSSFAIVAEINCTINVGVVLMALSVVYAATLYPFLSRLLNVFLPTEHAIKLLIIYSSRLAGFLFLCSFLTLVVYGLAT